MQDLWRPCGDQVEIETFAKAVKAENQAAVSKSVSKTPDLAERVGRRPVGNVRNLPAGGYRLRFRRSGEMRTSPEVYATRADAERALWKMADDGRAACHHDRRFRALVLLATFSSLRWGEATALSRCDVDLQAGTVRVRAAFTQRRSYSSAIILGPPKSRSGRRIVGIPKSIIPDKIITDSIDAHVEAEQGRQDDDDGPAGTLVPAG